MTEPWEPSSEQSDGLFAELGRCLYIYQSIELMLKFLLPHLVVPGTDTHAKCEGFANWRVFLDSKETLGPLMQRFKDRIVTEQRKQLDATWTQMVTHRNEVVHHFASQPFAKICSEAELTEAMQFLHHRRMLAAPMLEMLQQFNTAFMEVITSTEITRESTSAH